MLFENIAFCNEVNLPTPFLNKILHVRNAIQNLHQLTFVYDKQMPQSLRQVLNLRYTIDIVSVIRQNGANLSEQKEK